MLESLRLNPIIGGDNEESKIDPTRASEHCMHKALMARHVNKAKHGACLGRQIGEAEIDGHAPCLFLLQPVAIDPGQRFDKGGLAVIDVASSANDHCSALGNVSRARLSASAISLGDSRARTGPMNGAARMLPPTSALSNQASAATWSTGTPLPR